MKYKTYYGAIKAVTEDASNVFIEGYANLSKPDEENERLDPASMDDSRYTDNPTLLFNHEAAYVVGKSVTWEKRPEGVWVRGAISKSAHPDIAKVRDLVVEGMLKTFSVGYRGGTAEDDPEYPGTLLIKNWKLHEISIVPIPMQAQSTFTVAKSMSNQLKQCKSLSEARIMTLKMKGAAVAALLAPELEKMAPDIKDAAFAKIATEANLTPADVQNIVMGETQTVADPVLEILSTVFAIPVDALKAANATDDETPETEPAEPPDLQIEAAPAATVPEAAPALGVPELSQVASSIRECVVGKLPVLMSAGHSKEEAVAMAIAECSNEKGCAPSDLVDSDWGNFLSIEVEETKSVEPEKTKDVATVMDTGDNIHVQLLQQTVQMLGAISVKMDSLIAVVSAMSTTVNPLEPSNANVPVISLALEESEKQEKALLSEFQDLNARLKSYME